MKKYLKIDNNNKIISVVEANFKPTDNFRYVEVNEFEFDAKYNYYYDNGKITKVIDNSYKKFLYKQNRSLKVKKIKVTTSAGNSFDGDETSQQRMARAILALEENESIDWKLADNTIKKVAKAELREALRLAGEEQTKIWFEE